MKMFVKERADSIDHMIVQCINHPIYDLAGIFGLRKVVVLCQYCLWRSFALHIGGPLVLILWIDIGCLSFDSSLGQPSHKLPLEKHHEEKQRRSS